MNKYLKLGDLSTCHQELVNQYEKFRTSALDKFQVSSNHLPGFSILILRGTATWIETCLCSKQTSSSFPKTIKDHQTLESNLPSLPAHKEAVTILTHMILSHQKALRSNYA